jgi:hypothetical protein
MLLYVATDPRCGSSVLRSLLLHNFDMLTDSGWDASPRERAALAASAAIHAVKTHRFPVADPLPGEVAIQLIRHPGAAIASHYHLHRRLHGRERPVERFIAGQRNTGDWTSYHRAWATCPMPVLRQRFEDVTADQPAGLRKICAFLGLEVPETIRFVTAEEARRRNPVRNPAAPPDSWRELIRGEDLQKLREAHGALAGEWGYAID